MAVGESTGFHPGAPMTALTSLSHLRFNPPQPMVAVASCGDLTRSQSDSTTRLQSDCTRLHSDMSKLQSLASHFTTVPTSASLEDAKFPMYVVSVDNFLTFDFLPCHEDLLDRGLLEKVEDTDTPIHYVSQQWLSEAHPDPDGVRLRRFQEALRQIRSGEAPALFREGDWELFSAGAPSAGAREGLEPLTFQLDVARGYVWWDYLSIPQKKNKEAIQKQGAAIVSLPCYLEASKHFWVLAPEARHASLKKTVGYEDWQARGWCRMEEWGNFLSARRAPSLVLTEVPHVGVVDEMAFLAVRSGLGGLAQYAPYNGQFSCCDRNHRQKLKNGLQVELRCDRESVASVLEMMYNSKMQHCRQTGKHLLLKLLQCSAHAVLGGTALVTMPSCIEDMMEACGDDEIDSCYEGLTPLGWACSYGSLPMVRELLSHGARADQSVPLLILAVQRGSVELFDLLHSTGDLTGATLQRGTPTANITALDRSAQLGHTELCSRLLSARASPHPVRRDNGQTPLHTAAEAGRPEVCALLLKAGAGMDVADKLGRTPLMLAAQQLTLFGSWEGKAECARLLLQASADPEIRDGRMRLPRQVATADGHFSFLDVLNEQELKRRAEEISAPREEDFPAPGQRGLCSKNGCLLSSLFGCR